MNNNKRLYGYGILARLERTMGFVLFFICFIIMAFSQNWFFIIGIVLGVWLIFDGSAKEYDFKRRGGYIVYNG